VMMLKNTGRRMKVGSKLLRRRRKVRLCRVDSVVRRSAGVDHELRQSLESAITVGRAGGGAVLML